MHWSFITEEEKKYSCLYDKADKKYKECHRTKNASEELNLLLAIEECKENGLISNYFKHKKQTLEVVFKRCMGVFCNIADFNLRTKSLKSIWRSSVVAKFQTRYFLCRCSQRLPAQLCCNYVVSYRGYLFKT